MKVTYLGNNLSEYQQIYNFNKFKVEYNKFFNPSLNGKYSYIDNYVIYYKLFNNYIKLCDVSKFTYDEKVINNFSYNEFTHLLSGYTKFIIDNEKYILNHYYGLYLIHSKIYYYICKLKGIFKIKSNKIEFGYE